MSYDFRQEVLKLVVQNNYQRVAEIGVWKGELSRRLYFLVSDLILVDPWDVEWNCFPYRDMLYQCTMGEPEKTQAELDSMYQRILKDMPKATVLRLPSVIAAQEIEDRSLDLVFIDSVHTYEHCLEDILAWLPKVRPGGMISGDDYVPEHQAVARAVDQMFGTKSRDRVWYEGV